MCTVLPPRLRCVAFSWHKNIEHQAKNQNTDQGWGICKVSATPALASNKHERTWNINLQNLVLKHYLKYSNQPNREQQQWTNQCPCNQLPTTTKNFFQPNTCTCSSKTVTFKFWKVHLMNHGMTRKEQLWSFKKKLNLPPGSSQIICIVLLAQKT